MTPVWQKAEAQRCHRQSRGFPRPSRCSSTSWRTVKSHGEHSNPVWSIAFREVFKFSKQVFFGLFADSSYDYHPADPNMAWAPQLKSHERKIHIQMKVFHCFNVEIVDRVNLIKQYSVAFVDIINFCLYL